MPESWRLVYRSIKYFLADFFRGHEFPDIGYIKIGQNAQVKVMTYDYARYGSIPGKVTEISANTFTNKDNLPFYKAFVSLDKNYVGNNPEKNKVKPGMTVQVDIITGKKSIMAYLMKPITRALNESFRER